MALTYNSSSKSSEGAYWRVFANLSPDTSYATGGYTITPERVGLTRIEKVSVPNNPSGIQFNWDATTGKLLMGGYTGGGGALTFNGTPMGNHSHTLGGFVEAIARNASDYITVTGAGVFSVGETLTGGTSGSTATVTVANLAGTSDVGITPVLGEFQIGETVSGTVTGNTGTVATPRFSVYLPALPVVALTGATRDAVLGRGGLDISSNLYNPSLYTTYNTLVGSFVDTDIVTGGTSGNTAGITRRFAGGFEGYQIGWPAGAGFTLGETLTGSVSGATAVCTSSTHEAVVVMQTANAQYATGCFKIFYPINVNMATVRFTYLASASVSPDSAGTPAGTITGGGAIAFSEFPAATNVAALLSQFDVIIEGV